jgi:hypothetical protein
MIKSRKMRWEGHIAQMGAKRNAYRILMGKSEEKDHDFGGWTILKWMLER